MTEKVNAVENGLKVFAGMDTELPKESDFSVNKTVDAVNSRTIYNQRKCVWITIISFVERSINDIVVISVEIKFVIGHG